VALIAARAVVVEVEPEVWPVLYGYVVITVQVSLAAMPLLSKLVENDVGWWVI
jgi:hypothetical protein